MRVWWFVAAGLVAIGLAAAAYAIVGPSLATNAEVQYLTATATRTDVKAEVVASGTVQAARTYSLSFGSPAVVTSASPTATTGGADQGAGGSGTSNGSWTVTSVLVAVGDHVAADDTLASADTADLDAQIEVAQAQVDAAQERVDAGGNDQAKASAKSALLTAETTLADLEAQLAHASLVAPESGVVINVNIVEGDHAPNGAAVVLASDAMVASGTITETDVASIAVGQAATVTVSALSTDVAGSVSYVSPTGSSASGVVGFGVLVTLSDVPEGVRPGMSSDISVITDEVLDVVAVPSVALGGSSGSYTVTVLGDDGTPATRSVVVGLVTDDLAEITSGLAAGESVVTGTASDQQTTTNLGGGFPGGGFPGGGFPGGGN